MSERTRQDLDALREGLRLVEEWRRTHEDRARMARVDATAEMERRKAGAYAAVAAVVRRELEAPATGEDVRERVARELAGHRENYDGPDWYDHEVADRIIALLRAPRGEGEDTIPLSALRSEIAQLKARGLLPYLAWARLCALAGVGPVGEDTPAALRSEAQGEDRWEDLVFGPITEAYNEAHAARRGEGGGDG